MVRSARARPKGRCSHSAPQDLDATALRLDSTGWRMLGIVEFAQPQRKLPQAEIDAWHGGVRSAVVCAGYGRLIQPNSVSEVPGTIQLSRGLERL